MLIPVKDVLILIPVSRPMIYALIQRHKFPKPIKIGARSFWDKAEVKKWIASRRSDRGSVQ